MIFISQLALKRLQGSTLTMNVPLSCSTVSDSFLYPGIKEKAFTGAAVMLQPY
jgi:hypothetical protein